MTRSSPSKSPRRKATKAFLSPGTRKARRQAKDIIINQAAMDLIARTGENDKAPYGSMQKVLDRYSPYELSRSQVQKRVKRIKVQLSHRSLFLPIATTNPLPPPVAEIQIRSEQISGSPNSLLTGPS